MTEKMWKIKQGVNLEEDVAEEVAKIACAINHLAASGRGINSLIVGRDKR